MLKIKKLSKIFGVH